MKPGLLTLCALLVATSAAAQPALPTCKAPSGSSKTAPPPAAARTYHDYWCEKVLEIARLLGPDAGTGPKLGAARMGVENAVVVSGANWRAFLLYAQARSSAVDAGAVEDARTDKQVGAPAGSGSTSLVSKGAVPRIFGFAVENGALTQATSGTTVTLRGTLVGWLDLLKNQEFIAAYQDGSRFVRTLRRVSYSLTLNTGTDDAAEKPASSTPAVPSPEAIRAELDKTKQQLAGYSVRVALFDQRDPRTAANRARIATFADTQLTDLLRANDAFEKFLDSSEYTRKWVPETVDLLMNQTRTPSVAEVQRILYQRLEVLRLAMIGQIEGFDEALARNLLGLQAYDKARQRLFETISKQPLVAFELVNTRSKDLPDSSTARVIVEGQWGSRVDLTGNVAMTFQNSGTVVAPEPKAVGGRRDFQMAAQADVSLGSVARRVSGDVGAGPPVFGVALLSQKLTERAAVSFAGSTFTVEPGWVHAVQARVTVPVKGSGVKIPLSISYANRTELLKEKEVRGQVGLTFDLDVLSSVVRR